MGRTGESEYETAPAARGGGGGADRATSSSSFLSARNESLMKTGKRAESSSNSRTVEEQIERSKAHWSTLANESEGGGASNYGTASRSSLSAVSAAKEQAAVKEQIERSKAHWSTLADRSGAIQGERVSDRGTAPGKDQAVQATVTKSLPVVTVKERIERSKAHWSVLADQPSEGEGEEVAEVSNVEVFKALQSHPKLGSFFQTFGYDLNGGRYGSIGELVIGEKFAEGGQAEIYEAQVKWSNPKDYENEGSEYVLKVFKKGTFLKDLKFQLPLRNLQNREGRASLTDVVVPNYSCYGTLLNDSRFAFLMRKGHFDLRHLIDLNVFLRSGGERGPFSKEEAECLMYEIALGMDWLHSHNIVHRDLKASNVLVKEVKSGWPKWVCFVTDYESSIGVVGTGFFRAPEILQACKEDIESPGVFSKVADVYSFGMTCYEILTGKLPFEDHPLSDCSSLLTDLVINQHLRPQIPEYVEDWTCKLLRRCWQSDRSIRPSIGEILGVLETNSAKVRQHQNALKEQYGGYFTSDVKLVVAGGD